MPQLLRHAPPGNLNDFDALPGARDRWHSYITQTLADAVGNIERLGLTAATGGGAVLPRFHDGQKLEPGQPVLTLPVLWNAFPKKLLSRFGRDKAMVVADMLWPLTQAGNAPGEDFDPLSPQSRDIVDRARWWFRPHDEYCEWRIERDAATQRLQRVVFTVESPEYWMALHTGRLPHLRSDDAPWQPLFDFAGSPTLVARLYSTLLGQEVAAQDLCDVGGSYDVHNRWNTSHGIVHLTHPVNALCTHVRLCADSTVCRHDRTGRLITEATAFCCAQPSGDPNTHADPTIAGSVNALVRQGAWVALADPVGIVIDDVDISGWSLPNGVSPLDCLQIVRGEPGSILRLVVQAPPNSGLLLDELRIGGEPLRHGGQIAECITVKAQLRCSLPGTAAPLTALAPAREPHLIHANRRLLRCLSAGLPAPSGCTSAFGPIAVPPL
ncbi:MAG: hypothetical protein CFE32_13845 [Alphaproteobacteria bacterium PA3]|nr:MAG: hypothetical protein CFE32_13845 [Alphaproteobacteria bacterium PA3]